MAQEGAEVRAATVALAGTGLVAAVRRGIPVQIRITLFTTEAGVLIRDLEIGTLTGRATPRRPRSVRQRSGSRRECPFLDAVEVVDVVAAGTAPDGSITSDEVEAHEAFILSRTQLINEQTTLCFILPACCSRKIIFFVLCYSLHLSHV